LPSSNRDIKFSESSIADLYTILNRGPSGFSASRKWGYTDIYMRTCPKNFHAFFKHYRFEIVLKVCFDMDSPVGKDASSLQSVVMHRANFLNMVWLTANEKHL